MFTSILVEQVDEGMARITLNRPDRGNALFRDALSEIQQALRQIGADAATRVVVFTGRGRAFSGGADVNEFLNAQSVWDNKAYLTLLYETFRMIELLPQPVIAAVNGAAIGAGVELAASCDFAIAANGARFSMPEVPLGMVSVVQAALFKHYAPIGRIREWLYTGDEIDAWEAERWGLVNRVTAAAGLEEEVLRIARKIARAPLLSLRLQKELVNTRWLRSDLETGLRDSIDMGTLAHTTGEAQRRVRASVAARRADKGRWHADPSRALTDSPPSQPSP